MGTGRLDAVGRRFKYTDHARRQVSPVAAHHLNLYILAIDSAENEKGYVLVLGQRLSQASPALQSHPEKRANLHSLNHRQSL